MFSFSTKRKIPELQAAPTEFFIRQIWPNEVAELAAHLTRLSNADRRIRFGHVVSDRFLTNYAELALRPDCLVFAAVVGGIIRGIGEARPALMAETDIEAAFTVETGFKARGMGTGLFGHLMQAVSERGHTRALMACIRSNTRMIALAKKHGAEVLSGYEGAQKNTPFADEMVEEVLCLTLDLRQTTWSNSDWPNAY